MNKNILVVIKGGLPQCAEPIVCGDIVGQDALFCHAPKAPAVIRELSPKDFSIEDDQVRKLLLRRGAVLWEGRAPANTTEVTSKASSRKDVRDALIRDVSPLALASNLFICGTVTSTFDALWYLKKHVSLPAWTGLLASAQMQGRGQMRREWLSPRGNMYLSLLLPESELFRHEGAAIVVGYLVAKALRSLGYDVYLKWPNDIVTADLRKVGGILLEERDGVVMAGIGINLACAPSFDVLRNKYCLPADILSSSGNTDEKSTERFLQLSPFLLCKELVNSIIVEYIYALSSIDFASAMQEANMLLALKESRVHIVEEAPHVTSGVCRGLSPTGALLVQGDDGQSLAITSGGVLPESCSFNCLISDRIAHD